MGVQLTSKQRDGCLLGFVFLFPEEKAAISVEGLRRLSSHQPHKLWQAINSLFHQKLQITARLSRAKPLGQLPTALSMVPCV